MPPLRISLFPLSSLRRGFSTTPFRPAARLTIVGRLGVTPELKATSTGQEIIQYVVGTEYGPKDNRGTSWWRVTSFSDLGNMRERLMACGKGTLVYLEGEASMRPYENREGKTEYGLNIVQQKLEILERRSEQPSAEQRLEQE